MISDKAYEKLYKIILTLVVCFAGASFGYGQLKLDIPYPFMAATAAITCTFFIILIIIDYKLFYISVPVITAGIILYFSGIKTFPEYAERFYRWLIVLGNTEEEYSLNFSIIYALFLLQWVFLADLELL